MSSNNEIASLIRPELTKYEAASNLEFNNKIKQLQANGRKIHHFGFGQSPFPVPDQISKALQCHSHVHEYLSVQGLLPLRQKILKMHEVYDGLTHFRAEQMIIATGSKELIFGIMNVFNGTVLLPSPSWTTYLPQSRLAGCKAVIIPATYKHKYLIQPDDLEKTVVESCEPNGYKLLVLNSPNNPSGQIYTKDQLTKIAAVCRQHRILVISDEIYAWLIYGDAKHVSMSSVYPEGTIVTSGFSKWASLGGWRVGYALFPTELQSVYSAVASASSHTFTCAASPMQYALLDALDDYPQLMLYARHCAKILHALGDFAHSTLSAVGVKGHKSCAGYYFMPDFAVLKERFENGIQLTEAMLDQVNVALMPCDPHFLRPSKELTTRFCYVNFNGTDALKESMNLGLEANLDEIFLRKYCASTIEGIEVLAEWVEKMKK